VLLLSLVLALSTAAPAEIGIPAAALHFAEDFRATCLAGYGDYNRTRSAAKALGYVDNGLLVTRPESFLARKKQLTLVYRGLMPEAPAAAPQCMLQSEHVPGGSFERLAAAVDRIPGAVRTDGPARPRPTIRWSLATPEGKLLLSLVDDVLLGDRNVRLSVLPGTTDPK
jgi:hypothetical protein